MIKLGRVVLSRLILILICQIQHLRYMKISYKSIDFLTEDWSYLHMTATWFFFSLGAIAP